MTRAPNWLAVVIVACGSATSFAQAPAPAAAPASCAATGGVEFVCGQQGPEDLVVLPGARWVIASSMAGAGGLELIRVADHSVTRAYPSATAKVRQDTKTYPACPGPPTAEKFTTHGLYLEPGRGSTRRLFVVGHGAREAIEIFEVDARGATPSLTWIGCAIAPDPIGLNSVRGLADGGFITTNFLPRGGAQSATQKMLAGEKNGELWEWHTKSGWVKVPGSEAAGANGVELSADGRTLYIAAWGSQSFIRLSRGATPPKRDEIPLGFRVDNVHWANDGMLLAVGQVMGATPGSWKAVKIDPETLAVHEMLDRKDTSAFGAGTVAVEVGDRWWIGSFRGDRIEIVPAPR